jgi:hypothetical protein
MKSAPEERLKVRMLHAIATAEQQPEPEALAQSPLDILSRMSLTGSSEDLEKQMLDQSFIMERLAILGQWTVIYAPPNSGKTLLTIRLLSDAIQDNEEIDARKIFYVNADDDFRGAVSKLKVAEEYRFHMLVPGHRGFSVGKIPEMLKELAETQTASGVVIVLDTLKKFVDLMEKSAQSAFGVIVRNFIMAGGTVIALAHTNKNRNADGKNVRSGTSDILDDSDCAFVMNVDSATDSEQVVTFDNIKSRGDVDKSRSFRFNLHKGEDAWRKNFDSVEVIDKGDAEKAHEETLKQMLLEENREVVATIIETLTGHDFAGKNMGDIKSIVHELAEVPEKLVGKVLKAGRDIYWRESKSTDSKTAKIYRLISNATN